MPPWSKCLRRRQTLLRPNSSWGHFRHCRYKIEVTIVVKWRKYKMILHNFSFPPLQVVSQKFSIWGFNCITSICNYSKFTKFRHSRQQTSIQDERRSSISRTDIQRQKSHMWWKISLSVYEQLCYLWDFCHQNSGLVIRADLGSLSAHGNKMWLLYRFLSYNIQ